MNTAGVVAAWQNSNVHILLMYDGRSLPFLAACEPEVCVLRLSANCTRGQFWSLEGLGPGIGAGYGIRQGAKWEKVTNRSRVSVGKHKA